jgi:tRNA(Ile)-lysidine synthase
MPASLIPDLDDPSGLNGLFAAVAGEAAIGLAVSGGADSLALMVLAQRWASGQAGAPQIFVYSVDHGLRPEAAGEVAMAIAAAAKLGLSARGLAWSDAKPATGVQEAARIARYRLMGAAMAEDGARVLLTAHHLQDQAETVLMRMAHGSGLEGLRGMAVMADVEGVCVHRPLLGLDPKLLRAVVDEAGLVPVEDPSNADPHYERVRWRQVMPQLAALGLDAGMVAQLADRIGEADAAIAQIADGCRAGRARAVRGPEPGNLHATAEPGAQDRRRQAKTPGARPDRAAARRHCRGQSCQVDHPAGMRGASAR